MSAIKTEEYVEEGKVVRDPMNMQHIEDLVREAVIDLEEARLTQEIGAHRATFFLAYMAMLRAGRALLGLHGLRPVNSAQHKTIVDLTRQVMGGSADKITAHFEMVRKKQHELCSSGNNLLSELEAHDAFHYALLLVREIVKAVKTKNPGFHVTC